jgi:hypothetical protein
MAGEFQHEYQRDQEHGWTPVPVYNAPPASRAAEHEDHGGRIEMLGGIEARQLAQGLGWFSIALGVAEVAAPQWVAGLAGVEDSRDSRGLISAYGVREIANGLAILAQPDNPFWVQTRIGGDLLDLASLGMAYGGANNEQVKLRAALAAVAGVTALDVLCSLQLAGRSR